MSATSHPNVLASPTSSWLEEKRNRVTFDDPDRALAHKRNEGLGRYPVPGRMWCAAAT